MANKTRQAPKPKRGVGQVIARRRRSIAEAQERRSQEREAAEKMRTRDLMIELRQRTQEDPMYVRRIHQTRHALNVLRTDHKAFLAAVGHASVGVNLSISNIKGRHSVLPDDVGTTMAYTDFEDIYVQVPAPPLSKPLKDFVVEVRGMLHHEAGHVRFTIPLPELWEIVDYLPEEERKDSITISKAQIPWNMLEDQRMEAAVVKSTPRIANYFVPMVTEMLLRDKKDPRLTTEQNDSVAASAPWLILAGRDYLPNNIRMSAKREFDRVAERFGVTSDEWFSIISRYMSATTKEEMILSVFAAVRFLERMKEKLGGPNGPGNPGKGAVDTAIDNSLSNANEDHKKMRTAADRSNEDVDMEDAASSPSQPESGDEDDTGMALEEQLEQQAQESAEKLTTSAEINDIMSRISAAVMSSTISSDDDPGSTDMPNYLVDQARLLSGSIIDALEAFRVEKSPTWVHRQEQGYLDALAYRTKETGERTYHRDNVNWDNKGLGLHVSFLADRSGSMSGSMYSLSQTMWAVKQACNSLGIPSTMVLWSNPSATVRVMENDDTPVVYLAEGGTNPRTALDDLETHVQESGIHHLVFIFTDGGWSSVGSLTEYKRPDRTFVIVGLNCEEHIQQKDADVVIPITSIDHLKNHVQRIMTDYVAVTM
jgi:hypothetical protein